MVLRSISLAEAVDILIVALFIYLLLVWFRRSRARFMLIGMLIVGGIYLMARVLHLYLTTMAFQAFFAIFLFMVVVIFQDDFRRFFERIALLSIQRRTVRKKPLRQDVECLSNAIFGLSHRRVGALVVVRGRDALDRHLEGGVFVDALLSQTLLENLFDPHVSSHDGAVLVDGARISRFGCHLPLSTNYEEIGRHGTRHAAALGIAERSDALCLVVSEEAGTVSAAENGRMHTFLEQAELEGAIEAYYQRTFPRRRHGPIFDFIAGHFLEKLLALALAAALWVVFSYRKELIRRDFVVPIEYRNVAADIIIAEPKPKEVTLTLSGNEGQFSLLDPKELKLSIDLSGAKEGVNAFLLDERSIRYPSGLTYVSAAPQEVALRIDRMVTRSVFVSAALVKAPPRRYTVQKVTVEPAEVAVKVLGARRAEDLRVSTEPIDISGMTETKTVAARLNLPADVRLADEKAAEVKVTVEIQGPPAE